MAQPLHLPQANFICRLCRQKSTRLRRCIFKPAPSIPRAVLLEPTLFRRKAVSVLPELQEFFLGAFQHSSKGKVEVQAEHFHKAFSVDLVMGIAHLYGKGTGSCQGHKVQHILNGS